MYLRSLIVLKRGRHLGVYLADWLSKPELGSETELCFFFGEGRSGVEVRSLAGFALT